MAGLRLILGVRVTVLFKTVLFRLFSEYVIDTTYRSLIKKISFLLGSL
jgi:hypothetical protein